MKASQLLSEIALALVIIGAIVSISTGLGFELIVLGLILGIIGIVKAPSKKKRILGIIAAAGALFLFALMVFYLSLTLV